MPNNNANSYDKLPGVKCNVISCTYNGGNCCYADNIRVGAEHAHKKDETFCGTFAPKDLT